MSEQIKVREIVVGNLDIPNGKVDITDPCYDRDVWCRINTRHRQATAYPADPSPDR